MNNSRLRKSSDEVRVKLIDSNKPERHYWNLSGNTYSQREKGYDSENNYGNSSQIKIEFDLKETRKMTQEQKQTILNTLIAEDDRPEDHSKREKFSGLFPETGLIPLIALLAFLSFFFLIAIVVIAAGHPYYYY